MRRNHFPNIHISKAEIKRQIAKHPVLCFSHKPEKCPKSILLLFHSLLAPLGEASCQTEPRVGPLGNTKSLIRGTVDQGDGGINMGRPKDIQEFTEIKKIYTVCFSS